MNVRMVLVAIVLQLAAQSETWAGVFCFVSLPDTQHYAEDMRPPQPQALDPKGTFRYFDDQTKWVAEHRDDMNIQFVVHLGDIVQDARDTTQWDRSRETMQRIDDANVPYGMVIGNHDLLRERGHVYDAYLHNFGPQHFAEKPWFKGASPSGTSSYQIIPFDGYEFLFLNVSYATPDEELEWCSKVLEENRDKIAIVSTHAYLWDAGVAAGRYGESVGFALASGINLAGRIPGSMSSQDFYERFVTKHPNILMVQCGHSGLDWFRQDGVNGAGLPVLEVLTDYQALPNGGEGYLRIYEIDTDKGTLSARTYSPTKMRERTSFEHFAQLAAIALTKGGEKAEKKGGVNAKLARAATLGILKRDVVKEIDVVGENPEYQQNKEKYEEIFREAFFGKVPEDAGKLEDWEALWMQAFAPNPDDPKDYGPNERSPSFTIEVDLDKYLSKGGS